MNDSPINARKISLGSEHVSASIVKQTAWRAGVARRTINPPAGVELAGLGYYLHRVWRRVRDDLTATALVVTDHHEGSVAVVSLDLMYNGLAFTRRVRQLACAQTYLCPTAICVNVSHSHNAPTAGFIRGCGDRDEAYLEAAARAAANAVIGAWRARRPAVLFAGHGELTEMTFNRARENGPTDRLLSVLRIEETSGRPMAAAINFHSHCTAHMELDLQAVSRDWPGEVVDQIETSLPGVMAIYCQGTAGDVNFRREFNGTEKRFEPALALSMLALNAWQMARLVERPGVESIAFNVALPTRRWDRSEILGDREEGLHRMRTGDVHGWLEGLARRSVNQPERLPLRYGGSVEKAVAALARFAVEWTDDILPILDTRAEKLEAEVQALRIGDIWIAAHPSELFTSLGLDLRRQWPGDLFVLGYSNSSIGYLPDAKEFEHPSYATIQSPKFTGQFPFTPQSGATLVNALLEALHSID